MAFNKLNVVIGANIEALQKQLNRVEKDLQKFSRNMQRIGTDLTQLISVPIAGLGAASLKSFADIERLEKGLIALMGSTEAAQAEMLKLREVAKLPGLGFKEAVDGSLRLQAVGFSADAARKTLLAFGKAVAVSGGTREDFQEVIYQLSQMASKGKILSEDFKVLQSRIPILGQLLQDSFGTRSIEAIRNSGVGASEFIQKIIEAADKSDKLKNVTGGLSNAFENFKDSAKLALADLGKEINRVFNIEKLLANAANAIDKAVKGFNSLSDSTKRFILAAALIAATIGPALLIIGKLASVATLAVTGVKALGVAFTFLASPIGLAVVAITALTAAAVYAYRNNEQFRESVNEFGRQAVIAFNVINAVSKPVIENLVSGLKTSVLFGYEFVKQLFEIAKFFKPINDAVIQFGVNIIKYAVNGAAQFAANFSGAFQAVGSGLAAVGDLIVGKSANVGKAFKDGFLDGYRDTLFDFRKVTEKIVGVIDSAKKKADAPFKLPEIPTFTQPASTGGIPNLGGGNKGGATGQPFDLGAALADRDGVIKPIQKVNDGLAKIGETLRELAATDALKNFAEITEPLALIQTGSERTAQSLGALSAKSKELELANAGLNASQALVNSGFAAQQENLVGATENLALFKSQVEGLGAAFDVISEKAMPNLQGAVQVGLGVFADSLKDGVNGIKDLARAVLKSTASIIKNLIQTGVAAAVSNALKNPVGIVPPLGF